MERFLIALLYISLILSCNQNSSQAERDYIENLEEKNTALEKELQEEKNKSRSFHNSQGSNQEVNKTKEYFTIGSTETEVAEVMGDPSSYIVTAPEAKKFHYGLSTVYFKNGKVISFDNLEKNLKVNLIK